jgi:hypothetical protein
MRRGLTLAALPVLVAGLLVGAAQAAPAGPENFRAHLTGAEEVPQVDTRARGQSIFQLSKDGSELHFRLIVANIEDVTQAHIHCGARGVNGPVVAFLFGLVEEGVTHNGVLATGTLINADVIARPDSEVCPGGVANFDEMLDKMRTGEAYVNVHTIDNPAGEVRGQIHTGRP